MRSLLMSLRWLHAASSVLLAMLPLTAMAADKVTVYKCPGADGQPVFQQSPCREEAGQQQLQLSGDSEANIAAAEAQALREEQARIWQRERALAAEAQQRPMTAPALAPPQSLAPCPPTAENPGDACTYVVHADGRPI